MKLSPDKIRFERERNDDSVSEGAINSSPHLLSACSVPGPVCVLDVGSY